MRDNHDKPNRTHERVIFTLPRKVAADVVRYARIVRGGNKSGFVADAIEAYITQLRKFRHTRKLRSSYAAAAQDGQRVAEEWEALSDEVWAKIQ